MKNSYLALMYDQTPLNTLQMLFLLSHNKDAIWGQLFSCYKLKKKQNWKSERFKCHVQVSLGASEFSVSSLHDCCQHRLKLTLCAQWMQSWSPWTLLESEAKSTCAQRLGQSSDESMFRGWKQNHEGSEKYATGRMEAEILWVLILGNEGSGGFLTVFKYFAVLILKGNGLSH